MIQKTTCARLSETSATGVGIIRSTKRSEAARKCAGLAIVERNIIAGELADGCLAQLSEVEVSGRSDTDLKRRASIVKFRHNATG
jgi:hypothetical protein